MLLQRGVRLGFQPGQQLGSEGSRLDRRGTMPWPGTQATRLASQAQIPGDRRRPDLEHPRHCRPRHPPVDGRDHPQPEILGVGFHAPSIAP